MSARREKQFLRDNYLQTIQLIKTYKSLYFPFFVLLYILHEGLSVLKNFMVFVQLLGLASCSFCMFNSLILSISLFFSFFLYFNTVRAAALFCQLPVILPLSLSLLSVQFSFFLFLSISLSFSPFLSFSALLALASSYFFFYLSFSVLNYTSWICSESFTAIFVFLSFSVYISISLLVLSLSVILNS